jgi:hypothetical protein
LTAKLTLLTLTRGALRAENTDCRIVVCCCAFSVVWLAWVCEVVLVWL